MDTISHGFAGSVFARSLAEGPGARIALILGAAAAMIPDLDFLFFSTRLDYLREHRGWTHSFLVLPFLALALALLARVADRRARLVTLWLFAAVGILTHILFDWITSFGTMFFTPLTRTRYSLDWVFILDPIFTTIALAALVLSLVFRGHGRRIATAGAGVLAAYIALCALLHARALSTWKRMDQPPPGVRVAVLPQFLSPFRWMGISEHDDEIHVAFFDIGPFASGAENPEPPKKWTEIIQSLRDYYPPPEKAQIQRFPRPPASPPLAAARALPDWDVYLAFARFPLETVYPDGSGGAEVIVQDLRFLPWFTGPWERGGNEGIRRQPFVFRARFDASLRPVESGFVRDGRR
jgi:inner membrane protein